MAERVGGIIGCICPGQPWYNGWLPGRNFGEDIVRREPVLNPCSMRTGRLSAARPHLPQLPAEEFSLMMDSSPDLQRPGRNPRIPHLLTVLRRIIRALRAIHTIHSSGLFDKDFYLRRYPDARKRWTPPLFDYVWEGRFRGRNPHPLFDGAFYLRMYPDVKRTAVDPFAHYILHGAAEGRIFHPMFDTSYYLTRNWDDSKKSMLPLAHYMLHGAQQGQDPHPFFDTKYYLAQLPEAERIAAGRNPLIHFLTWGWERGFIPHERFSNVAEREKILPRLVSGDLNPYEIWRILNDSLDAVDQQNIRARIAGMDSKPLISVVLPVWNTAEPFLEGSIRSVLGQFYENWELCIADDASTAPWVKPLLERFQQEDRRIKIIWRKENGGIAENTNSALTMASGSHVAFLDHDDELTEHALYLVAEEINSHPDAGIIYSDEDHIYPDGGRSDPYFKTDWNPDLFCSQNYLNHLTVCRRDLVERVGGLRTGLDGSQDYDLLLHLIEHLDASEIRHIPHILYHWRIQETPTTFSTKFRARSVRAARQAIAEHFARLGESVQVVPAPELDDFHRVIRPVPAPEPLVTLIIPTKDATQLLRKCINGLLHGTDYPNLEIIVVANNTSLPEALRYLEVLREQPKVRVIPFNFPWNFSRINNFAIQQARGAIVGLVNDDIEVIEAGWLREMVSHSVRPEVGVVGAKLYYPDDTIQHAGVILGIGGIAGHAFKGGSRVSAGYFGRAKLLHDCSAVTGACMLFRREIFYEIGEFDEVNLAIAFNDVDFCIRARERGYRIVMTPYAELYHHESASRGSDQTRKTRPRFLRESQYLKQRWKEVLLSDPFYSPNLTLENEVFSLAFPTRAPKAWRGQKDMRGRISLDG